MSTISPSKKTQLERFEQAARQLETEDHEERFPEQLPKLVTRGPDEKISSSGDN